MMHPLLTLAAVITAIGSLSFAIWASRRARWFEQSLKFRRGAISITDEIFNDKDAPQRVKNIAAILRVMSISPKTLRHISSMSKVLMTNSAGPNLFDGIASKYADRLATAIKQLAVAAMLDDPTHAPALSRLLSERMKPQQKQKQEEVAAIRRVIYLRLNEYSNNDHNDHNDRLLATC